MLPRFTNKLGAIRAMTSGLPAILFNTHALPLNETFMNGENLSKLSYLYGLRFSRQYIQAGHLQTL